MIFVQSASKVNLGALYFAVIDNLHVNQEE